MICALIYCMCYLYLQFIWPCLEIKSEFFTTRKKSQQQTLSSNCSSNTNPFCDLSTQFDLNQWNSGHFGQSKRKFARHFVDLLATKSHFFVFKDKTLALYVICSWEKNQLTALNNAHWLKLGLTCLTQPGKHTRYLWMNYKRKII